MDQTNTSSRKKDIVLLILRIIAAGIFVFASWAKVTDMTATIGFFSALKIPIFLAYVVSYGELLGGIALLFGILTQYVAFFLSIIMVVAVYFTLPGGIRSVALSLATFIILIFILKFGSGKYKIKALV